MLEFLRERAFPTWDFFDATARRRLLERHPGQEIAAEVTRRLPDLGPLNPHLQGPFMWRPAYQISVTRVRSPQPPGRGLLGKLRHPDNSLDGRDTGVDVMVLLLSAFAPFACPSWLWPQTEPDPALDPRDTEEAVRILLRGQGLTVLTREEILVPVRGMKGTPYSVEGRIPNVCHCLFDATSFLMQGLGPKQFRSQGQGDLWPSPVDDSA